MSSFRQRTAIVVQTADVACYLGQGFLAPFGNSFPFVMARSDSSKLFIASTESDGIYNFAIDLEEMLFGCK